MDSIKNSGARKRVPSLANNAHESNNEWLRSVEGKPANAAFRLYANDHFVLSLYQYTEIACLFCLALKSFEKLKRVIKKTHTHTKQRMSVSREFRSSE